MTNPSILPDAAPANWVDTHAPAALRPWLKLGRFDRPAGIWLLMLPGWQGVALASSMQQSWPKLWPLLAITIGAALMRHAIAAANARGHGAVILRGDPVYYARFGFNAEKTAYLALPGPFERERLLAIELHHGALDGARGMIVATGAAAPEARSHRDRKPQRPMPRAA